jgi:hypothetical protein
VAGRIEDYAIVGARNAGLVRQMSAEPCQARSKMTGQAMTPQTARR